MLARKVATVEMTLACLVLLLFFFGFKGFFIVDGYLGMFVVAGLGFFFSLGFATCLRGLQKIE